MKFLQRTVARKEFIRQITMKVEPWIHVPGSSLNYNVQLTEESINEFWKLPTELNSKLLRVEQNGNNCTHYHFVGDEAFVSQLQRLCNNLRNDDESEKTIECWRLKLYSISCILFRAKRASLPCIRNYLARTNLPCK